MFSQVKTMTLYRVTRPIDLISDDAAKHFIGTEFLPRLPSSFSAIGWAPLLATLTDRYFVERHLNRQLTDESPLMEAVLPQPSMVYQCDGHVILRMVQDQATLPPQQVQQLLASKIEAMEREQGRALKKKEREALKEEILVTLLPHAYTRRASTLVWYHPQSGLLAVFAKGSKADTALALLRKTIGSLPAIPVAVKNPPEMTMTEWLTEGNLPASFTLEDAAELRSAMQHGGIARFKQQDLLTEEIKNHLVNDKLVTKLALNWGETLSFVLSDDLAITSIKWSDELREQNDDVTSEDPLARLDADAALLTGELSQFVPALLAALGGEEPAPL